MTPWEEAERIVNGARSKQYGSPERNFDKIASLWGAYLGRNLDAADVARMMVLFKIARDLGPKPVRDNLVDAHGYLMCLGQVTGRNADEARTLDFAARPAGDPVDPRLSEQYFQDGAASEIG
jgi:hypothetical protein